MTDIDVLQWFEQDFALDAEVFDNPYNGKNLQEAPIQCNSDTHSSTRSRDTVAAVDRKHC